MHLKVKLFMFFMNLFIKFPLQSEVLSSKLFRGVERHFNKVNYDTVIF
jgi:hypothetical protein